MKQLQLKESHFVQSYTILVAFDGPVNGSWGLVNGSNSARIQQRENRFDSEAHPTSNLQDMVLRIYIHNFCCPLEAVVTLHRL
jgi:hypothetical protein